MAKGNSNKQQIKAKKIKYHIMIENAKKAAQQRAIAYNIKTGNAPKGA